jgi:hypothetical protein
MPQGLLLFKSVITCDSPDQLTLSAGLPMRNNPY